MYESISTCNCTKYIANGTINENFNIQNYHIIYTFGIKIKLWYFYIYAVSILCYILISTYFFHPHTVSMLDVHKTVFLFNIISSIFSMVVCSVAAAVLARMVWKVPWLYETRSYPDFLFFVPYQDCFLWIFNALWWILLNDLKAVLEVNQKLMVPWRKNSLWCGPRSGCIFLSLYIYCTARVYEKSTHSMHLSICPQ